ncbi:hypothetical protein KR093_001059 [Drosophila rubida]|uniref:Prominin-like protein n=1 Tax=Drosophila rubida TaxID=30044 RepID=A0AAD4PJ32_9MUSC|nr:hypothetical protein KR093_001059 [Drosophila rubida]
MTADYLKPKAARHKKTAVKRRHRQIAYLAICSLSVIIFGFALATLIRPAHADNKVDNGQELRSNLQSFGTIHEINNVTHFKETNYTSYNPTTNYTKAPTMYSPAMDPVFNFTHLVFDKLFARKTALPPGYVVLKSTGSIALGPKVLNNDWRDLLHHYWVVLIVMLLLLLLVVIVPFIAVCYCCFCCCRNCKEGCPPCDTEKDGRKRCCYGLFLLLLIIGLLFGIIIALVTNKMLDNGFEDTTITLRRAGLDTCTFLKDVSDHIHHLFIYNFEELETNLNAILHGTFSNYYSLTTQFIWHSFNLEIPLHTYMDLMESSEMTLVYELERIFNNTAEVLELLIDLQQLDKELRFNAAQLRDLLRGAKLNVNHACTVLCGSRECLQFLKITQIEFLDSSRCLHLDALPNTTNFLLGSRRINEMKIFKYPLAAIKRVEQIKKQIGLTIAPITPQISSDIRSGKEVFRHQATKIRNIIDSVLSDVHAHTLKSTRAFDDVYNRFGSDRSMISIFICVFLVVILFALTIALICGCCGRRRRGFRDDCCSKGTGATCLLLAILLIFCVFSVTILVGLLYFILGIITYQGACAPLRDREKNELFRQLDSTFDFNHYLPKTDRPSETPLPTFRISKAIKACHADESIFELLQKNNLYDIDDLLRLKVLRDPPEEKGPIFTESFSNFTVFTDDEKASLMAAAKGNLSTFKAELYLSVLCKQLTPVDLPTMANQLRELRSSLWSQWGLYDWARTALENEAFNLEKIYDEFHTKIITSITKMEETVRQIDKLALYKDLSFGDSILTLVEATDRGEKFIRESAQEFVNRLLLNMTVDLESQIDKYVHMVIEECRTSVGKCAPLAYIYDRSVDHICKRIVDPINGFWVGVLLSGLLFLPILFVGHRLLCLYRKIDPYSAPTGGIVEGGSDYLYDAYSEREREHEHVPLANVPKKRRKAYERRREQQDYYEDASPGVSRGSRGGGGGGMANGGGDAAGGSNMRYNDVAPTHWDHEPPRYHNPPVAPPSSEYERPPPYYYPGASDQD